MWLPKRFQYAIFINCYDGKMRKNMGKGKPCAALLTDLSKAFDCIVVHDFLIAKLEACGFSYEALKVKYNYLTDRKHRTKVNNSFLLNYCWMSPKVQF